MQWILTLINERPYLNLPQDWAGWLSFAILVTLGGIYGFSSWRQISQLTGRRLAALGLLLLTIPFTSLFLGVSAPDNGEETAASMMFLQAIPVLFAAGLFGPAAGTLAGGLAGLMLALWGTHSPGAVFEYALIGMIFGLFNHQAYQLSFYKIIRNPLASVVLVIVSLVPIQIFLTFAFAVGPLPVKLDAALIQVWPGFIARSLEVIQAGLVAQVFYSTHLIRWGKHGESEIAPVELGLQKRFLFSALPFFFVLFLVLTIGDWLVAGRAAREMLAGRMAASAEVAAESLPYFLEAGQSLVVSSINPLWPEMSRELIAQDLDKRLDAVPFFQEFILLDLSGERMASAPQSAAPMTAEELTGASYALKGLPVQTYTMPPAAGQVSSRVAFITGYKNQNGELAGVFIGRTDLVTNPFTRPAIRALNSLEDLQGTGLILDENMRVLYNPHGTDLMKLVGWELPSETGLFEGTNAANEKVLNYYYAVTGRPWSVLLTIPAVKAQELALSIAGQLLILLAMMCLIAIILLQIGVGSISRSLIQLSNQTALFAQGQLTQPMNVEGRGEIGKLADNFEVMRISLKSRLDELNKLLLISQSVAQNTDFAKSIDPILEAALLPGAISARLIHSPDGVAAARLETFALGTESDRFSTLDESILRRVEEGSDLIVPNSARVRHLLFESPGEKPGALAAFPLRYEETNFGALWVAYPEAHFFDSSEIRFLNTLAGLAGVAAATAQLFSNSEIGRRRLEAVVNSTPEPVLVIDNNSKLLIFNPAALQVAGLINSARIGMDVGDAVSSPQLLELLCSPLAERTATREISLANGTTYHASVAPVSAEGKQVGRICILRDVTQYKELDTLKSDFVATVSHDLRSPLTLMKGYATMLQLVGELNDQQKSYVTKIQGGVETMSRLINNLLDLGRVEGGLVLNYDDISPEDLVNQVMASLTPLAEQKKIRFAIEGMDCQTIRVDRALMEQVFYNLVDNAIKYSPLNSIVLVKFSQDDQRTTFEIRDSGIGIAPLDLPRLFEKFYRSGRREAYQARGSGLGLAIVKSIVEQHKGRVWVESQLGKGSSFFFEVPNRG